MFRFLPVHPLIRITSFLVLVLSLISASWWDLCVVAVGLAVYYLYFGAVEWQKLVRMLTRMRWFFLAIVLFYFWLTPGTPIVANTDLWLPSFEGINQGLLRVIALVVIITSIHIILQATPREKLIASIYGMLMPFKRLFSPQRLALRIILTLNAVEALQNENVLSMNKVDKALPPRQRLQYMLVNIFDSIHQRAISTPSYTIEIPDFQLPPPVQWLLPFGLGLLLMVIK